MPTYKGWGTVVHALDPILATPVPMPPVQQRVDAILAGIDWSRPRIVLWVPGTNEHEIPPKALPALHQQLPGERLHYILYEASWRFADSVPDGMAVMRGVLEGIRRHGGSHQVLLAGESQGAWLISAVLADPQLGPIVTRAALWGRPAAAPVNFADGHDPRVRETDNPSDIVTRDLGKADNARLIHAVDQFARHSILHGLLPILGYGLLHPGVLFGLAGGQLWRLPGVGSKHPSPHGYDSDMAAGVRFLRTGER